MNYLSVFSGIEAASVAWKDLGWEAKGFAEIDEFASAVLAHHYPTVKNYGDITKHQTWDIAPGSVDILIGGSPCQSFSASGKRTGLADPRGQLSLTYINLVKRLQPKWIVWENVGNVLRSNQGRDFAHFIISLGQCGYGWTYRVLDSKHWGVPQQRRRVWLVAHLTDPSRSFRALFEQQGNPRDKQKDWPWAVSPTLQTSCGDYSRADGFVIIDQGCGLRRLSEIEAERLQGFPDDWTKVPFKNKPADKCPSVRRYKAIGNSMATPVLKWIGSRIDLIEKGKL